MISVNKMLEFYPDKKVIIVYDRHLQNPAYTGDGMITTMVDSVLQMLDEENPKPPIIINLNSELLVKAFRLVVKRNLIKAEDIIILTDVGNVTNEIQFDKRGQLSDYSWENAFDDLLMDLIGYGGEDYQKFYVFKKEREAIIL